MDGLRSRDTKCAVADNLHFASRESISDWRKMMRERWRPTKEAFGEHACQRPWHARAGLEVRPFNISAECNLAACALGVLWSMLSMRADEKRELVRSVWTMCMDDCAAAKFSISVTAVHATKHRCDQASSMTRSRATLVI